MSMQCLYPNDALQSAASQFPLMMKVDTGGVVIAFATTQLAERFAREVGVADSHHVLAIAELGSASAPYSNCWAKTEQAILFDTDQMLEDYLRDTQSFDFDKHIITLRGQAFQSDG
jgi:hypothetical protein